MSKGNKITESEMIKWWVDYHSNPRMTQLDLVKKYKRHKSTISRLFQTIKNTPALLQKANAALAGLEVDKPKRGGGRKKNNNPNKHEFEFTSYQALQDENMFLNWWLVGERKGYVDLLLKKMQDNK